MQPAYTRIRRFTAQTLGLMFAGQAAAFWLTPYFGLLKSLLTAGFVMLPLLMALPFLFAGNPLRTLGAGIAYLPLLVFCYYAEFLAPAASGGAPMAYVAAFLYGVPLILLALWLSPYVFRCFGITAVNDKPAE
ncbi:MAG: hypothetical protein Q4A62_04085 [Eikenella sp.]|nr:hypothetical protein [Eikenella sp.]